MKTTAKFAFQLFLVDQLELIKLKIKNVIGILKECRQRKYFRVTVFWMQESEKYRKREAKLESLIMDQTVLFLREELMINLEKFMPFYWSRSSWQSSRSG